MTTPEATEVDAGDRVATEQRRPQIDAGRLSPDENRRVGPATLEMHHLGRLRRSRIDHCRVLAGPRLWHCDTAGHDETDAKGDANFHGTPPGLVVRAVTKADDLEILYHHIGSFVK